MDYALLGIGITLLAVLGWVVTALYDLKDRATALTNHMNAIQRQIGDLPQPVVNTSELADISRRLASISTMTRASLRRPPEPTPAVEAPSAVERVVERVEYAKVGLDLLKQRLASRRSA